MPSNIEASSFLVEFLSANGHSMDHSLINATRSPLVRTYQSADFGESEESYEPLRKKPEQNGEREHVLMDTPAPVTEETISRTELSAHEAALNTLPPVRKVSSLPRDKGKASSVYSTPNFKRLMSTEKKKLAKDGFYDEERSKIKYVDSRYKSMPTLVNSVEQESPRSAKDSIRSAEFPPAHPKGMFLSLLLL